MLFQQNRPTTGLSSSGVHKEQGLLWLLVVCLDRESKRRVTNERTITDEVPTVTHLVKVAEDIEVDTEGLVPLSDGFVDGDIDAPDTTTISNGMTVMKTNLQSVDVEVRVIPRGDDELDSLLTFEVVREKVIHVKLKRVAVLGGKTGLLRGSSVVARMTGDDQFVF